MRKQAFDEWLQNHPQETRTLWALQNCLGTLFGFEHPMAEAARKAWEASDLKANAFERLPKEKLNDCCLKTYPRLCKCAPIEVKPEESTERKLFEFHQLKMFMVSLFGAELGRQDDVEHLMEMARLCLDGWMKKAKSQCAPCQPKCCNCDAGRIIDSTKERKRIIEFCPCKCHVGTAKSGFAGGGSIPRKKRGHKKKCDCNPAFCVFGGCDCPCHKPEEKLDPKKLYGCDAQCVTCGKRGLHVCKPDAK